MYTLYTAFTSYAEHMENNPTAYIQNGPDLDHNMEYDDGSGWETCLRCGEQENQIDDICTDSGEARDDFVSWQDYEEDENTGQRRLWTPGYDAY
jgi:hypothetical protein